MARLLDLTFLDFLFFFFLSSFFPGHITAWHCVLSFTFGFGKCIRGGGWRLYGVWDWILTDWFTTILNEWYLVYLLYLLYMITICVDLHW